MIAPPSETVRVLVLGATGMLGNAVMRFLSASPGYTAYGSARSTAAATHLPLDVRARIVPCADVENPDALIQLFARVNPAVVVNCIGLVKQLPGASDPLALIPLNSLLPHRLARVCELIGARLVHISTDCVFSGAKGFYREDDLPDANDWYGRSKMLGEVDYAHAVTLRTSIIGHELNGCHGLINWFLSQRGVVKGYKAAVFSGLPTVELALVIRDYVIPRSNLRGVFHVAASPISKYDLLELVREAYQTTSKLVPVENVVIDRSLNAERFEAATGYVAPDWTELVRRMHDFQ